MEIVFTPDPVLKKSCEEVDPKDIPQLKKTLKEMAKLMYASSGCGLAAPQVGISKSFVVIDCTEGEKKNPTYLINPVILETSGEPVTSHEGCLSVPGIYVPVTRQENCVVEYYDLDGKKITYSAEGFEGRCIQHEVDHLHGITMLEHLPITKRIEAFKAYEQAREQGAKPGDVSIVID